VHSGVMSRQIDKNHFLYLNVSGVPKEILMKGNSRSILFDKDYSGNFTIARLNLSLLRLSKIKTMKQKRKC
jgi:beta-galactosidase